MNAARAIAVAQTVPERGNVAANVEQHVELARVASELGARIVVYPELSLTGYELDLAAELAFDRHDARLDPLTELARSLDLTLIVGAPVRLDTGLHIAAFILSPDRPAELHTKRRLGAFPASVNPNGSVPPGEATVFEPGGRQPLVRIGNETAAIAICAEAADPDHVARAATNGATSYLASMFVIPSEHARDTERLAGYAARHSLVVAFANYGGPTGGLEAAGRSAIWSERGKRLIQLESGRSGVAVARKVATGWQAHPGN